MFKIILSTVRLNKDMMRRAFHTCGIFILLFEFVSCKKLVDIPPPSTSLTSDNVYQNDQTAASVMTGIYTFLSQSFGVNGDQITNLSLLGGVSSDELTLYGEAANQNTFLKEFYLNKLSPGNALSSGLSLWTSAYRNIYTLNLAIEKLSVSPELTPVVKRQLIGEAKFLRGFIYFYLVNLYGELPLVLSSDYRINANLTRSSKERVYQQIISDLQAASGLLTDSYLAADAKTITTDRVRPNKWAATALLARVYLFSKDWVNAESNADSVINKIELYDTTSLNNVFLKNSKEAIWQLQPVNSGWNTEDARFFILPITGPTTFNNPVYLTTQLLNSFEANDNRKINWISKVIVGSGPTSATYYYANKYKSAVLNAAVTEYQMALRLSEQYLIRSEARAQQNNIFGASADLNIIRKRAGISNTTAMDKTTLLTAILHERQTELFTEWGHRWLDLKRTDKINDVMNLIAPFKGTTWSSDWALFPIPLYDIIQNPKLIQNPGY